MSPSALSGRRAADGLEVSHRGTEAASAKRRDDFSRLLASFRLLASLAVFGFSSFLRASVPP
jgi:hypothetical protein